MATGKNTKRKTKNSGSQANVQNHGLMALESRVLFSAAALVSDVPEPVNDDAAAIEASLVPGESHSIINPDSMRPVANSFRGCVPTDPCLLRGQTIGKADSFFDIFNRGSAQVINPDSMRPADAQRIGISPIPTPTPGGGSVMVINPDSMRPADNPEGSNPTPHPMPVPELSDSVSKRRLEHGPGMMDMIGNGINNTGDGRVP